MSDQEKWRFRVEDTLEAIQRIQILIEGHQTAEALKEDWKSYQAVERNLQIIAEASKNLPESVKSLCSGIEWRRIIGMRNVIVHEYSNVDYDIIWKSIHNDLPSLEAALHDILTHHTQGDTSK